MASTKFPAPPIPCGSGRGATNPFPGHADRPRSASSPNVDAVAKNVGSVGFITGQNLSASGAVSCRTVRKSKNGAFSIQGGFNGMENINSMRIIQVPSTLWTSGSGARWPSSASASGTSYSLRTRAHWARRHHQRHHLRSGRRVPLYAERRSAGRRAYHLPNDTLRYAFNQTGVIGSFVVVPKPGSPHVVENDVKNYLAQLNKVSWTTKACPAASICRTNTTRCRGCSPASRCSVGWSPSAPSSRARSASEHHVNRGQSAPARSACARRSGPRPRPSSP